MSITFVNIKKIALFSKPYMVAEEEAAVDLITFFLVHDVHSASYKRRLTLDERSGNDRRTSRHTELSF